MNCRLRHALPAIELVLLAACGGGGGGGGGPPPALSVTVGTLPDGVVGTFYNATIGVSGGTGARNFTITAGALPAGLALNAAAGVINGVPGGPAATTTFTIQVTDSGTPQQSASRSINLDLNDPLAVTNLPLPDATIGVAYGHQLGATGGTPPYSFASIGNPLPAGISLGAAGNLTGTALPAATSASIAVAVTDGSSPPQTLIEGMLFKVTFEITTTALPDATGTVPYGQTLNAQGGVPPYQAWMRVAGSMPPGIADPNIFGDIAGTPVGVCAAATSAFTVQARDSYLPAATDTQALSITVNPGVLNIATAALPNGVVGTPYNTFVRATGGGNPYSFSTSGTLPGMLGPIDAATGRISGTPNTAETRTFNVHVSDSCGASVTRTFTIAINATSLGRNDSIATATPLFNGSFSSASISPIGNPNTVIAPDQDYYLLATTTDSIVTVDIDSSRFGRPLDSVIEFVDAAGARLNTCVAPAFTSPCVHDDEDPGVLLDSFLQVRVVGPTTFYVRIVDWRGDARPDMQYDITINGIN